MLSRIRMLHSEGNRFGISMTILGELYFAVYASRRVGENLARLNGLRSTLFLWPYDEMAAEEFGRIQGEQRAQGRPIPPMDAQIAAVARVFNLVVLTADQHFRTIRNLPVEDWL